MTQVYQDLQKLGNRKIHFDDIQKIIALDFSDGQGHDLTDLIYDQNSNIFGVKKTMVNFSI
ncbi:MAG: hypothetical protein AABX16_05140 [Nanoarchaeota archaeon]